MRSNNHRNYQLITVVAGLAIVFILFFAPRTQVDMRFADYSADEAAVTLALTYMNDEKGPMKGIKMLDRIAELDPNNIVAVKQLAEFSMQTGQYAKAVPRYEHLIKLSTGDEKVNALIGLSNAAQLSGDTLKAIKAMEEIFEISNDSLLLQSSKQRIDLLKKP